MAEPSDTPHITLELCKETKQKLIFEPRSIEEARFIVDQLKGMGYDYFRAHYANELEKTLKGCLYFDTDRTIMVSDSKQQGIPCSIDGFKQFFIPEGALDGNPRISLDDCWHKKLAFYPRTNAEARCILTALMKTGAVPPETNDSAASMMTQAIVYGVLVRDGRIAFGPTAQDLIGAEICSAADLGVRPAITLSAEQATIMAAFNEMGARLEQMSHRIARLEDEILPKQIEKRQLPKLKP
jgi:hypothetical protein